MKLFKCLNSEEDKLIDKPNLNKLVSQLKRASLPREFRCSNLSFIEKIPSNKEWKTCLKRLSKTASKELIILSETSPKQLTLKLGLELATLPKVEVFLLLISEASLLSGSPFSLSLPCAVYFSRGRPISETTLDMQSYDNICSALAWHLKLEGPLETMSLIQKRIGAFQKVRFLAESLWIRDFFSFQEVSLMERAIEEDCSDSVSNFLHEFQTQHKDKKKLIQEMFGYLKQRIEEGPLDSLFSEEDSEYSSGYPEFQKNEENQDHQNVDKKIPHPKLFHLGSLKIKSGDLDHYIQRNETPGFILAHNHNKPQEDLKFPEIIATSSHNSIPHDKRSVDNSSEKDKFASNIKKRGSDTSGNPNNQPNVQDFFQGNCAIEEDIHSEDNSESSSKSTPQNSFNSPKHPFSNQTSGLDKDPKFSKMAKKFITKSAVSPQKKKLRLSLLDEETSEMNYQKMSKKVFETCENRNHRILSPVSPDTKYKKKSALANLNIGLKKAKTGSTRYIHFDDEDRFNSYLSPGPHTPEKPAEVHMNTVQDVMAPTAGNPSSNQNQIPRMLKQTSLDLYDKKRQRPKSVFVFQGFTLQNTQNENAEESHNIGGKGMGNRLNSFSDEDICSAISSASPQSRLKSRRTIEFPLYKPIHPRLVSPRGVLQASSSQRTSFVLTSPRLQSFYSVYSLRLNGALSGLLPAFLESLTTEVGLALTFSEKETLLGHRADLSRRPLDFLLLLRLFERDKDREVPGGAASDLNSLREILFSEARFIDCLLAEPQHSSLQSPRSAEEVFSEQKLLIDRYFGAVIRVLVLEEPSHLNQNQILNLETLLQGSNESILGAFEVWLNDSNKQERDNTLVENLKLIYEVLFHKKEIPNQLNHEFNLVQSSPQPCSIEHRESKGFKSSKLKIVIETEEKEEPKVVETIEKDTLSKPSKSSKPKLTLPLIVSPKEGEKPEPFMLNIKEEKALSPSSIISEKGNLTSQDSPSRGFDNSMSPESLTRLAVMNVVLFSTRTPSSLSSKEVWEIRMVL